MCELALDATDAPRAITARGGIPHLGQHFNRGGLNASAEALALTPPFQQPGNFKKGHEGPVDGDC